MSVYLDAVRGRLMAEKSRSLAARLITKAVVAWARSFWHRSRATTVSRLPAGEPHYTSIQIITMRVLNIWSTDLLDW